MTDRNLAPDAKLRIPFNDIASATDNFAIANLIKEGTISDLYRGKLMRSEKLIRKFHRSSELDYSDFLIEVHKLSRLNHRNILSIVGFCDENGEMIMVFNYEVQGSLYDHLSDPNLTWSEILKICIGAARASQYIHEVIEGHLKDGIYHDIRSSKILLDKDKEAKLFCFGLHVDRHIVHSVPNRYTEPEYKLMTWGTHKSDVYSFGVILLEVLCGRKAENEEGGAEESLVSMAKRLYKEGNLNDIVHLHLRKQFLPQSLFIVLKTAYDCVKTRSTRPKMNEIVEDLQEALDLPMIREIFVKDYAYLKIPLNDIMLATGDFAPTYCIGSYRDGELYKAELNHFDINTSGTIEGELPKIRGPVTIKRNTKTNLFRQEAKSFIEEVKRVTRLKHPNIVPLLGFSWEGSEMILVFECAVNGSLADYLGTSEKPYLTWEQQVLICLDIAHGLEYIHTNTISYSDEHMHIYYNYIHDNLDTSNVMLGDKWNAKIADFQLFKLESWSSDWTNYYTANRSGERTDSEYIYYFFGVVMSEILFARSAYLQQHFTRKGPDDRSLKTFETIANLCMHVETFGDIDESSLLLLQQSVIEYSPNLLYLTEWEVKSSPVKEIIISLEKALSYQVGNMEFLKIELSEIKDATDSFTKDEIGIGGYGVVYRAELNVFDRSLMTIDGNKRTVAIKRNLGKKGEHGKKVFLDELEMVSRCEHSNIIPLLGYCFEDPEMILVYEYASNGSLDDYITKGKLSELSWTRRLKMCVDIAYGLHYLHTADDNKRCIIHCDIKSDNILLCENLEVKIADFGFSMFHPTNHPSETINTGYKGTPGYMDPEFWKDNKLKIESDIYSFGVILLELVSGKLTYDKEYRIKDGNGIAPVARRHFKEGTLMEMVDTKMKRAHKLSSTLMMGPNLASLDEFLKLACECVAEAQADRPKMKEVISRLQRALDFQENSNDTLEISLKDIRFDGEKYLSDTNCIKKGEYSMLYNGEVRYNDGYKCVIVKRMSKSRIEAACNWGEFEIPFKYRHENVIGLVGYCKNGEEENFIVYEYASNHSLDTHLDKAYFTWKERLNVCIDIAKGLNFLHVGVGGQDVVIHGDLKRSNILLTEDWKAKICGFDVSKINPKIQEIHNAENKFEGSPGYSHPLFKAHDSLTKEGDIYSLGVILFEILCGKLAYSASGVYLDSLVKRHCEQGTLDELVFEGIKEQIEPNSLAKFRRIAFRCLNDQSTERPTAAKVVEHLLEALNIQEAYENSDSTPLQEGKLLEKESSMLEDGSFYIVGQEPLISVKRKEHGGQTSATSSAVENKDALEFSNGKKRRKVVIQDLDALTNHITEKVREDFTEELSNARAKIAALETKLVLLSGNVSRVRNSGCSSGGWFDKFDEIEEPIPCDIMEPYGTMKNRLARGFAYPSSRDGVEPGHVNVRVDTIEYGCGIYSVVVPTKELTNLSEARNHIIQWPRKAIKVLDEHKREHKNKVTEMVKSENIIDDHP